jgi:hypothetical protein
VTRSRKNSPTPYKSGYCTYAPHQYPCKGEYPNGGRARRPTTLCGCECHGDYEERMAAAGYRIEAPEPEPVEDE